MRPDHAGAVMARADEGTEQVTDWPGQRAAWFERDVMPHLDRVYCAALRIAGDQADAEDLVQETFASAHAAFGQTEPGTNVTAWLYRILIGTFATSCRKQQHEPHPAPADGNRDWPLPRARSPIRRRLTPAEIKAVERLPGSAVRRGLQQLPLDFRIVVYLADVEGLAYPEIAGILAAPTETVISQLHCGRRQLREVLRDYAARPSQDETRLEWHPSAGQGDIR
jgi:RNA polymerase sigma-70 factor (ECF subfamily)